MARIAIFLKRRTRCWLGRLRSGVLYAAVLTGAAVWSSEAAQTQETPTWHRHDFGAVRLVAAGPPNAEGTMWLGLAFELAPGWKIYWRTPGVGGYPPRLVLEEASAVSEVRLLFPKPTPFVLFGAQNWGYGEEEVLLPVSVQLAGPDLAGPDLAKPDLDTLTAEVSYLTCNAICVPIQTRLTLSLGGDAVFYPHAIDRARKLVPMPRVESLFESIFFQAEAPSDPSSTTGPTEGPMRLEALFKPTPDFPNAPLEVIFEDLETKNGPLVFSPASLAVQYDGRTRITALGVPSGRVQVESAGDTASLDGASPKLALRVTARFAEVGLTEHLVTAAPGVPGVRGEAGSLGTLALMLLIALLGGVLLNFMPCVLPVLSLKLLGLVQADRASDPPSPGQSRDDTSGRDRRTRRVRALFLASFLGVWSCFMSLGVIFALLQASGARVGWGIQFQSPLFLAAMTGILLFFAASLFGWFELRLPGGVSRFLSQRPLHIQDTSWLGSFLTGAFATILATPCLGPFLGTALSFALTQGPAETCAIFACLGLGMGSPYLAGVVVPRPTRFLPTPGPWMVHVRRLFGVGVLLTVGWLLWLMSDWAVQLAVVAGAAGMLGLMRLFKKRQGLVLVLGLLGLSLTPSLAREGLPVPASLTETARGISRGVSWGTAWEPFDPMVLSSALQAGERVYVHFTADWCVLCKLNEQRVLTVADRREISRELSNREADPPRSPDQNQRPVRWMRGDWTHPDPELEAWLKRHGRFGIPFDIVYGPERPGGILLPEILSRDGVRRALVSALKKG